MFCAGRERLESWSPGPEVLLFILKSHPKVFRKRQHKSQILQNVLIQKWAQNLLVFSSCRCCLLSSSGACPASASENMWIILLPCKAEHLDSSMLIPVFNSCQLCVLLAIVGSTVASALGLPSCTWHCSSWSLISCHQNQCLQLSVLQSEFLLLGFLLFHNCNPSGHLMKHKSNSSAGVLSLDFAVRGGQLHFWSWMKIHVTLAHLNLSLRFIWLEVMCLSEGKKTSSVSTVWKLETWNSL